MATITSLGIGSGTDINSIVTQLVALERRPLQQMQASASKLQTQVSAFGRMQGLFGALQTASNALTDGAMWSRSSAKSSDETAVSTLAGSSASAGNYAVEVQALASSQTLVGSSTFAAANDTVGSGTLTITLGRWDEAAATFTDQTGATPLTIDVQPGDTLQNLRDRINSAGGGVTASLVTDASGVRLSLRSSKTGAEHAFRVAASDADPAGLGRFAYDPAAPGAGMTLKLAAGDARATVNGIDVVSSSNELSGTVDGLTLRLRKVTSAPVDVTVSSDRDAVQAAVKSFVDAYNGLAGYLAEQTKYDATAKAGGLLQGDSAVTGLQSRLRAALNNGSQASSVYPRLSDVGLQLQRDGTLLIKQGRLDDAMANLPEMKKAFSNVDAVEGSNAADGFARRYAALATQVLGVDGSLSTRTAGLQKLLAKNSQSQTALNDRVENYQKRLVAQYSAMDANLAKMNSLSSYVTQQLAAMNKAG